MIRTCATKIQRKLSTRKTRTHAMFHYKMYNNHILDDDHTEMYVQWNSTHKICCCISAKIKIYLVAIRCVFITWYFMCAHTCTHAHVNDIDAMCSVHTHEIYHLKKWVRFHFARCLYSSRSKTIFLRPFSMCAATQYLLNPFTVPPPSPLFFSVPYSLNTFYYFIFSVLKTFQISRHHIMAVHVCVCMLDFERILWKKMSFIVTKNMIACKEKDKRMRWVTVTAHNSKKRRRDSKTNKHRAQCNWKQKKWRNFLQSFSTCWIQLTSHFTFLSLSIPFMSIVIKRFETEFKIFGSESECGAFSIPYNGLNMY